MKKRKKPIFLAAIVILLVVSVMAFNASALSAATQSPGVNAGQLTADQQVEKSKLDQDQKKLAQEEAAQAKKAAEARPSSGVMVSDNGDNDVAIKGHDVSAVGKDQPKIMAPGNNMAKKANPQEASINAQGQWYRPESGAGH